MSLSERYLAACPLLLGSDILTLHPTCKLGPSALYDEQLSARHTIDLRAHMVLQVLAAGSPYAALQLIAKGGGISSAQLRELLGFLQMSGSLCRYRQLRYWIAGFQLQLHMLARGVRAPGMAFRYLGTTYGLANAIAHASGPLVVASLVVSLFGLLAGMPLYAVSIMLGYGLCLFIASVYIHEAAHLVCLRWYTVPAIIVRQGLRLGILHGKLPRRQDMHVALIGPLCGMTFCSCALAVSLALHHGGAVLASASCLLIHGGSFLPWYGDGQSIKAAMAKRKGASND